MLISLAITLGCAQDPDYAPPPAAPRPAVSAPRVGVDDPTQPDALMRNALRKPGAVNEATGEARTPVLPMPVIAIRGLVVARGKPGSAVVEQGTTRLHVEVGSLLGGGDVDFVRVDAITANGSEVVSQTTGARVVVH